MFSLHISRPTLLGATKAVQLVIYYMGKLFFSFTRVEVRGAEHIRRFQGNAVFASNHASELDPVVICLALDKAKGLRGRLPIVFLSREKEVGKSESSPATTDANRSARTAAASGNAGVASLRVFPERRALLVSHGERGDYRFCRGGVLSLWDVLERKSAGPRSGISTARNA